MRIAIIGGGSWGTALGALLAGKGYQAGLLVRDAELAEQINCRKENDRYLPGLRLPDGLEAAVKPEAVLSGADICLIATPCQHIRTTLSELAGFLPPAIPVICSSKGVEISTLRTMSGVLGEIIPDLGGRYAILSGPSFAAEVARGLPSAVVLGCADKKLGERLRNVFSTPLFRVYSSQDVPGVELGGALKNIMAIAAGLSDGLGLGHNARSALITRGLAEMSRLGAALGARKRTFMGLSGLGDLVLTCTGDLSRNRQVGLRLARGETLAQITGPMRQVAEGVKTVQAAYTLGQKLGIDLPITSTVHSVLHDGATPAEAVRVLMTRELKEE